MKVWTKRILSLALALVMLLGLAACGNESGNNESVSSESAGDYSETVEFSCTTYYSLHYADAGYDLEEDEFKKRVDQYFEKLYERAVACGGLVSGEHGIGRGKIKYLKESVGDTNMALMEGIKKVFDPNMILNPGKVCYNL